MTQETGMAEPKDGDWLQIGGVTMDGFGNGKIEVRVCTGAPNAWQWRTLSEAQKLYLCKLANEHLDELGPIGARCR